jgi:diacylglycerol kinase (ATP)
VPSPTLLILNPQAGRGAARFGRVQRIVADALGEIEVARTRAPRDASRIAREAVRAGVTRVVVGGGDGTLSEVVTGLLDAGLGGYAEIGILPLGSGCDFARSVGVPPGVEDAISLMRDGSRARVDAARIQYRGHDGNPRTSYFLNEASFGLAGLTVALVNRIGKRFGPRAAFALGSVGAILRGCEPDVSIRVDERTVFEGRIAMVVAANGRHFGSGMQIAPDALVDDGALDVVIIERLSRLRLLARFPSLYRGTHLRYPEVHHHRGLRIEARLRGSDYAPLDVDGEAVGMLSATIEVLPKAIGLFGLPARGAALTASV